MSVLNQSICISKTGLSSYEIKKVKYKDALPEVLDSNQLKQLKIPLKI